MSTSNLLVDSRKGQVVAQNYEPVNYSARHLGSLWGVTEHPKVVFDKYFDNKKKVVANSSNKNKRFEKLLRIWESQLEYVEENSLPIALKEIEEEIKFSKEILSLSDGWDGFDAPAIPLDIYETSIKFLREHARFVYDKIGHVIPSPEINPGRNENIFLSWRTKNARLAINIIKNNEGEGISAVYYGDCYNNSETIKGNLKTSKVSEFLAYWMKNL